MFRKDFILAAVALSCLIMPATAQPKSPWILLDGQEVHPTRILAKYKSDVAVQDRVNVLRSVGVQTDRRFKIVPGLVALDNAAGNVAPLGADPDTDRLAELLNARIEALRQSGQFEYVQPVYIYHKDLEPSDARFTDGTLWGLRNNGDSGGRVGADIDAVRAWDITTGSREVVVAVIDTGVRYTHQELRSQMWRNPGETGFDDEGRPKETNGLDDDEDGYTDNVFGINAITDSGDPNDFDGHGTHVAGTIGAMANGGGPMVGVAWEVQIMALKFLDTFGGTNEDGIKCIEFAVEKGVKISNNSWGGQFDDPALRDAIQAARQGDHLFIAAAGNDGVDNDEFPHYPSQYDLDNIISVAALDRKDQLAGFSNYGKVGVDLGGPGVAITSLASSSDTAYQELNGTSMATPHVTGVAALVAAEFPEASFTQIKERLFATVVPVLELSDKTSTGGRVNAFNALTAMPDGILDVAMTPPDGSVLLAGTTNLFTAKVTDLFSVLGADVVGTIPGEGEDAEDVIIPFLDLGTGGDVQANNGVYSANFLVPEMGTSLVINLTVTAPGKTPFNATYTYTITPAPPNDAFENASKIPAGGAQVLANNQFATIQQGIEPLHADVQSVAHSLWWNWSPLEDDRVLLDSIGSTFDTVMAVYTGNQLNRLTKVASVNDAGGRQQGFLTFNATRGVTYRIAIAGANEDEFGTIRARLTPGGSPDTTRPAVSIASPASGGVVRTDTVTVTGTSMDIQPNASGISQVLVQVNSQIGTSASGTTEWSSIVRLQPGPNEIRAVSVDFAGNRSEPALIILTFRANAVENDLFARAIRLTGMEGSTTGTTGGAAKEFGEPLHGGNEGGRSVWWSWVAPEDGLLTVDTEGSSFDTLLGIYSGSRVNQLRTLVQNDDASLDTTSSKVLQAVREGSTYYIAVDGFSGASGDVVLNYEFTSSQVFSLVATSSEGGSVSPALGDYVIDTTVTVKANPVAGFEFLNWEGNVDPQANPLTLRMNRDFTIHAIFVERTFSDDFETGDFSRLPWTREGGVAANSASPWVVEEDIVSGGEFAARSGQIQNSQRSSLFLTGMMREGTGSFDYKVSSEDGWDFLEFYVNQKRVQRWSGDIDWASYEFPVSSGSNTLEWRYVKDVNGTLGLDAAFIDNVDLPIALAPDETTPAILSLSRLPDGLFRLKLTGQVDQEYTIEVSSNLRDWSTIATRVASNGVIFFTDPDSGVAPVRFYRAVVR